MPAHPRNGVAFWGLAVEKSGCLVWTGRMTPDGYGRYGSAGVHRVAYAKTHGAIPDGLTIDHLCSNRACINPDHLEAVPMLVNIQRGVRATATHCRHGHPYNEQNTRIDVDSLGRSSRRCRSCDAAAQRRSKANRGIR